jgi:DNA repair exonuclease SbcCD ATPase subunit
VSSEDVAKQLDERDAGYKAEIDQLKGRIAELLDEKEQREGQLKKVQGLLVTSEAEASDTKAELQRLKEQATKWEVDVARLNADLASKLSNPLTFILPDILCPTYHSLFGITIMPTYTHISDIFFVFQASSLPLLTMLRRPCM